MKNNLHYVIFDGTSNFVGDINDFVSDQDNICIGTFADLEEACIVCDSANNDILRDNDI